MDQSTLQTSLTVDNCTPLRLADQEQVAAIVSRYNALPFTREHSGVFLDQLLRRNNSWFVQVGEAGLVYFTNIIPDWCGDVNAVFWDGHLSADRREVMKKIVMLTMDRFNLRRLNAFVPAKNKPFFVTLKKIGFAAEGLQRMAWRDASGDCDLHVLGLLREDLWP
jgi:hypothetical protein